MGTPDFAVPTLQAIYDAGHEVLAVFTQPDKPKGRGYKLTPPPIKVCAMEHNTTVYQPKSLKKGDEAPKFQQIIKDLSPDFIVVVAYGKILPKEVLEVPKFACVNVHASLLPKYRGAGPIQWSVLNGEKETGVTTMLMAEGLDTGDMLLKSSTEIGVNETASQLHDRLSEMGAKLLIETIEKFDKIVPQKQDDSLFCYAPMLTKEMCHIDFSKSAQEIHNQIRGLSDWPCATAMLNGKKIKIYKSEIISQDNIVTPVGKVVDNKEFAVACGKGIIKFNEIQAEGSKRMSVSDYLRGKPLTAGEILE